MRARPGCDAGRRGTDHLGIKPEQEQDTMDGITPPRFRVNELTPDPNVAFDPQVVRTYVTYAIAWPRAIW